MRKYFLIVILSFVIIPVSILQCNTIHNSCMSDIEVCINSMDGIVERIKIWNDSEDNLYVFLPSYANLNYIYFHLEENVDFSINGGRVENEDVCNGLSINQVYDCIINRKSYSLQFRQADEIPAMFISTQSGTEKKLNADKSNKEKATIVLYNETGECSYYCESEMAKISSRGNSSWEHEKKPYNLTLPDDISLLGMHQSSNWILLANSMDSSNLKNFMIYNFINQYCTSLSAPSCKFVELYLNGEFKGLYLLAERVEVNESYGIHSEDILFSLDLEARLKTKSNTHILNQGISFEVRNPKNFSAQSENELYDYLIRYQNSLYNLNSEEYLDYIDLCSWSEKYLIEEIFLNPDAGSCSQYFWIDSSSHQIYAGPAWDYDMILGGTSLNNPNSLVANRMWKEDNVYTPWYRYLYNHSSFYRYTIEKYSKDFLPQLIDLMENKIETYYNMIKSSAENNSIRWKTKDSSYEIENMKKFMEQRITFLNSAWIDDVEYCTICVKTAGNYLYYSCKKGENIDNIPSPKDLRLSNDESWYVEGTDKVFDSGSPIWNDTTLYAKYDKMRLDLHIILEIGFILFLVAACVIEYRKIMARGNCSND